ncbi:AMP-binding protein [Tistrella bauzanensis]
MAGGVALAGGGEAPGRVAVLSPNAARGFAVVLSCLRAGITWVPINARNALDENLFIMNQAKVSVLAVADAFADDLPRILAAVPGITAVLMLGDAPPPAGGWAGGGGGRRRAGRSATTGAGSCSRS